MAEVSSTFMLGIGDRAPEFELPDAHGAVHQLSQISGSQGTIVVFLCNHCPYVIHLAETLGKLAHQATALGVRTVAIVSNDLTRYPQDGPEPMKEFAAANNWDFPYLIDADQSVAKAFGAACTPDFFLFNGERNLVYAGQFDDSRPRSGVPASGADLWAAIDAMLAGKPAPASRPSSGCNIKWLPGNEPEWFR